MIRGDWLWIMLALPGLIGLLLLASGVVGFR